MNFELIQPVNPTYSALEQVLTNRGIVRKNIFDYINTTDKYINDFMSLGENVLKNAVRNLILTIQNNSLVGIIVDCDLDGYFASALLINYLHDIFPNWVESRVIWFHHDAKQHGLSDILDDIIKSKCKLLIAPDCATNDVIECKILSDKGCPIIILDHHQQEDLNPFATIINNQCSNYPNKSLCGTGVVWQFCRYLDSLLNLNHSDKYLDLVAIALTGDMSTLLSFETRHLITKGLKEENVHNPFIRYMWEKNKFKLGDELTSWGAAFYIVPLVNAITRSGTQEEKEDVFESMITFKALEEIPSTKRGHNFGEMEKRVERAIRICTNVKNRQTKIINAGMEILEDMIERDNMMKDKVLLFLNDGIIPKTVAGLAANKIMAKYQRPCCILAKGEDEDGFFYAGSARGCEIVGIKDFKKICEDSGCCSFTAGHPNAFGLGLREENLTEYVSQTNKILANIKDEPIYYVDYIYNGENVNSQQILDIADMNKYWGKDMQPALIAVKGLKITANMVTLMSPDKNPTLKISLPNRTSIIKFSSSEDEYNKFNTEGYVEVNIIAEASKNEWNGNINAQLMIKDYEIIDSCKYYF